MREVTVQVHLCAIPNVDFNNFLKCLAQASPAPRPAPQLPLLATLAILAAVLL